MRLGAFNPMRRRFPLAYLVRSAGSLTKVRFHSLAWVRAAVTLYRICNIYSPSPPLMRRPSSYPTVDPSPSVSTLTPSGFHPHGHYTPHDPGPQLAREVDCHLHNIRSSINARNRWFDKGYTIIVETNTAQVHGRNITLRALVPASLRLRRDSVHHPESFSVAGTSSILFRA